MLHTVGGLYERFGGPSRTVPSLCNALARRGTTVNLVSQTFDGVPVSGHLLDPEVRLALTDTRDHAGSGILSWRKFAALLGQVAADSKPELIHDHGAWAGNNHSAAVVARRVHVPLVSSPRGMLMRWALSHRRYRKKIALLLYQRADLDSVACFIVTSADEGEDLRRLGLRQPIAIVPNGVSGAPELALREPRARSAGGERVALFLSRLHPGKGAQDLIAAWAALRPPGWKLQIAGPDEDGYGAHLSSLITEHGLTECCSLTGPVDEHDKWGVYAAADLFVLPTYSENFGVTVAEALMAGLPVITTTGAPWECLRTHDCGWWVQPGVPSIQRALQEALATPDAVRHAMGARGKDYVMKTLSWDKVAHDTQRCYEWLLGRGPRPDEHMLD
ncbi:MAG TPA: glycosyltransferase [Burkholderiales bacterium]|nr:glycosyltransferase [Burkholderiales bacterium]